MTKHVTLDLKALRSALRDPEGTDFSGAQFNRYDLISEIARGGMGIVFRAKHRELGSEVALKLLAQADPSPDALARFRREARVLAQIKHPNVVGISDLGEDHGISFLAMELIDGCSLQDLLDAERVAKRPLPIARAVEITLAIARALEHCHGLGAIHRDVKPDNILIEEATGRAVLTDFGLVKRDPSKMDQDASVSAAVSHDGKLLGTPAYMAPEQFEPNGPYGKVGEKSDVWALGAVLFTALTGAPPFRAANVVDLYAMVLGKEPPRASAVRAGLPEALDALCRDCFAKKVDERLSMTQLVKRLELLQQNAKLLKDRSRSPGLLQGLALIGLLLLLGIGHLTLIRPDQGRDLWFALTGRSDGWESALEGLYEGEEEGTGPTVQAGEVDQLRARAEAGDGDAMLRYGALLQRGGAGVTKDPKAGFLWLGRAAAAGNVRAMVFTGQALARGRGTRRNAAQALEWFEKAAARGNPTAMFWLGHLYRAGAVGDPQPQEALRWFEKAAEAAGDAPEYQEVAAKARSAAKGLRGRRGTRN